MSASWQGILLMLLLGLVMLPAEGASSPTSACPKFPVPRKVKLQQVAEDMVVSGVPMNIVRLESEEPVKVIQDFYRETWASAEKSQAPLEYPLGPWQVIAAQRGECFYTVQLKEFGRSGTEGLLGVSARPGKPPVKEAVPMLPGSDIVNDMAHNDSGKTARTVMIRNGFSPAANADFYRRNLEGDGWRVTSHHRLNDGPQPGDVLILRKGVREVSVATIRDPQDARHSNVVLNYVDQP